MTVSGATAAAEVYNPATGTWSATGAMTTVRQAHLAVRLGDGTVLVSGGHNGAGTGYASAELYNPATGTWTATGSMKSIRTAFTLTLLADGRVLAAAGAPGPVLAPTAEIYEPVGAFQPLFRVTAVA